MKKHLLFLILCLMGILTSCSQKHTRYYIGVSQCSDDEWRHNGRNLANFAGNEGFPDEKAVFSAACAGAGACADALLGG